MNRRHASVVAAIAFLIAGCSSSSPAISTGAGNTLRADVLALTRAAATHQWSAADQALAQLRGDLTAAVAAGGLSPDRAEAIRADVAAIAGDLAAHRVAETPTTSSSTPQPKPTKSSESPKPKPPGHDGGPGHGHGHGGEGKD